VVTVEHYERIRRMVLVEGLSQRETAERLGHSRKTVRKALKHSQPPGYRRVSEPRRPIIGPVKHIIDAWREEDHKRPRKQRHTGQRIFERLRDEYVFTESASTVRRYVAECQQTQGEVFFPLSFDPGEEAQVDWGEGWGIENSIERKAFLFCMRMCQSGASFVYPYERATQEALLDGHVRAFEFFGAVARTVAYRSETLFSQQSGHFISRRSFAPKFSPILSPQTPSLPAVYAETIFLHRTVRYPLDGRRRTRNR